MKTEREKLETLKHVIDVIIPTCEKDLGTLELCIEGCRKNITGLRRIIVISKEKYTDNAEWFDERFFPFSLSDVEHLIEVPKREGWYFQQLLKLYSFSIPDIAENVLAVDSDTIFLRPVSFFEDIKPLYNTASEYVKPYFKHMSRLLPELKREELSMSGVAHHMLFQKTVLSDLINRVEKHHDTVFWKVFLQSVEKNSDVGASEYEIYFNFILNEYKDRIKVRKLRWMNSPTINLQLFRCFLFDYVSCHIQHRKKLSVKDWVELLMKMILTTISYILRDLFPALDKMPVLLPKLPFSSIF